MKTGGSKYVVASVILALLAVGENRFAEARGGSKAGTARVEASAARDRLPNGMPRASVSTHVDTFVLAEYSFETGSEGWVGVDRTTQIGTFFHVDDFAGLGGGDFGRLTPLEGQKSLWCGARDPSTIAMCAYTALPGYGNGWSQEFESIVFPVLGTVILSYKVRWDSEAGYDETRVQYLDNGGIFRDLPVNGIGRYEGVGELDEYLIIPSNNIADTLQIRFVFQSDGAWSDEDGLFNTDGAVIIDSLMIQDASGIIYYQDFETEPVGALSTEDGMWISQGSEAFGEFAGLFPGISIKQDDPCLTNITALWGFFEGSTSTYCGCGYPHVPQQAAVPVGRYINGWEGIVINNDIWSPPMSWTEDIHGTTIPSTASEAWLEYDVYRDLPLDCYLFWVWHIRSITDGCPGVWRDHNFVYYGGQRQWLRWQQSISTFVDADTDSIQVALGVVDMCPVWCIWGPINNCHTHAPLFDNVRVIRVDQSGPAWAVRDLELFQDNFSTDGTTTGTVRADIALDILPSSSPGILPGDSSVVVISEPNFGLDYHTSGVAATGPAAYLHVKDLGSSKSGDAVTGDLVRWPVRAAANGWTVLQCDTAYTRSGGPAADKYCVDLNDDLYTPGDTVYFYFSARDAIGRTTYWSRAAGTTDDELEVLTTPMEMTCLPANALGGATDVLYVDGFDNRGAQPFFDSTFELLGITPDRFDIRQPSSMVGNGLGSRVVDIAQQITAYYQAIVWNSGDLSRGTVGDGTGNPEKSDDFGVLYEFLDTRAGPVGVYLSGDDLADEWAWRSGTSAVNLRNKYMNFAIVNQNHVAAGQPVTPDVMGQQGSLFDHGGNLDQFLAYGGCPGINDFDVLQASDSSAVAAAYSNNPAHAAVLSQVTTNLFGYSASVVLSGFSFDLIRDDAIQEPIDRAEHLYDILNWFGNATNPPSAADPPPSFRNELSQNYPNPFNPTTRIRYSIKETGRVTLRIYNVSGQRVATIKDEVQTPRSGGYIVTWDGTNDSGQAVSSGVYFYKLTAKNYSKNRKMLLLR